MKPITQTLTELTAAAFAQCGYDPALGVVGLSDRLDLCQFQCNGAFAAAKQYHKAPFVIAGEVAAVLAENLIFAEVQAVRPGFLNLTVTDVFLAEAAKTQMADPHLGIHQADFPETIIIDYGGPNVAKPLHIGHLRSAIIGEALKRLARAVGHRVLGDVHLGDWGLQIGLVIAELSERYPDWRCFAPDFDPETETVSALSAADLNEIYPFASKRSKEDAAFKEKAHLATCELQSGRPGYIALWKEILRVSVADMKGNYQKLGVDFDLWYGESDADRYVEPLMALLDEKELLRRSEGALVVDVAEEGDKAPMPPVIVRKSDNSSIYATTDLATIMQRQQDFSPNRIWYVVDKRQELHFTQVFRCARKAGLIADHAELAYLGFGTMNGSDGKPYKTRDGGVMRLADLIAAVEEAAGEKLAGSAFVSEPERQETARKVGVAALKFGDLINQRGKDYIFDLERFLSFEGKTGTYLLYTVTRINSILQKAGGGACQLFGIYNDADRELWLNLLLTGAVFERAFEEKAPNNLCENAYQLAALFSRFYHDNHILAEEDEKKRESWLALCRMVKKVLEKHLDVLGIETVERM
ncbi:MAG: arginine--tRNA ligase [Oscillospiraceae bacterium]|jgi:arginyl-tRNA synthetase|nr:arginine--tRNA ligase [Oscillospiraceae bacterium]